LQLRIDARQEFLRKTGPDSAGKHEPLRTLVADKQGSEIFPVSFRQRIATDNELLGFGDLEFDPRTAAPTAFVDGISSFGHLPSRFVFTPVTSQPNDRTFDNFASGHSFERIQTKLQEQGVH
jgi:hypothetical protein